MALGQNAKASSYYHDGPQRLASTAVDGDDGKQWRIYFLKCSHTTAVASAFDHTQIYVRDTQGTRSVGSSYAGMRRCTLL